MERASIAPMPWELTMSEVQIVTAGPGQVEALVDLYNDIFRPPQTVEFFKRRFLGRYNVIMLFATVDGRPIGFVIGFELKPSMFYMWLCGVVPDYRRAGVAAQLMEGLHAWAAEHEYQYVRTECHNRHREILKIAVELGYDVVGVRWDSERAENLIVFEKVLSD